MKTLHDLYNFNTREIESTQRITPREAKKRNDRFDRLRDPRHWVEQDDETPSIDDD